MPNSPRIRKIFASTGTRSWQPVTVSDIGVLATSAPQKIYHKKFTTYSGSIWLQVDNPAMVLAIRQYLFYDRAKPDTPHKC